MKTFYLLLLTLSISAVSCRTKEGEPGPAGETSLNKQGSISGTITYNDDNGNAATAPFNHQYYESLEDNRFYYVDSEGDYYELAFKRRDLKDANNYFHIEATGDSEDGLEEDPYFSNIHFSFFTIINNELYHFRDIYDVEISNVSLDPATGRLTCDFSGYVNYDSDESASIIGKVDVILNGSNSDLDIYVP